MLSYRLGGNTPAEYGVAALARSAELPSVEVRVAIGALRADIGEHPAYVTGTARHRGVHAAKRIAGLSVVLKLGLGSKRGPACGGVAVLTSNLDRAVRIPGGPGDLSAADACAHQAQQDEESRT